MPSVHVGWALLVAVTIVRAVRSRWRWLALAYPALTTLAVVVTANHFWLDGIAAAALLGLVFAVRFAGRSARHALAGRGEQVTVPPQSLADDSPERRVVSHSADRLSRRNDELPGRRFLATPPTNP